MRNASAALVSFLNNPINLYCIQIDLYTFALTSGEIIRWSGGDTSITVPAAGFPVGSINHGSDQVFTLGPKFGRSKVTNKIGVAPAELDIELIAGVNDLVGTFTIAEAIRLGIFDGATVELDRFFATQLSSQTIFYTLASDIGTTLTDDSLTPIILTSDGTISYGSGPVDTALGCLIWFYGRIADCDIGRSKTMVKVKSLMNLLAIHQMPRRLYGSSCTHIFGDTMCGFDRVTGDNALGTPTGFGQGSFTAQTGSTQNLLNTGVAIHPFYVEGTIIGTSGANSGFTRTIASNGSGTQIATVTPFLYPVIVGDSFNILVGCDHTVTRCSSFLNLLRFGGFPYIPPPEQSV